MDNATRLDDLQRQAETFLHDQLLQHRASLADVVREVIKLAVDGEDNLLKELVRAADHDHSDPAYAQSPLPLSSSPDIVRQRSSKFSLRFSRNKDKDRCSSTSGSSSSRQPGAKGSLGQSSQHAEMIQNAGNLGLLAPDDVKTFLSQIGRNDTGPSCSSKSAKTKPSSSMAHSCAFCGESYSSKGTCKRHLEDMHVSRKFQQCNTCQAKFNTVPEARKHCEECKPGGPAFTECKPPARQAYASEFEDKCFQTQQQYIEHLLELCARPKEQRPRISYHRKLRNLLSQDIFQDATRSSSIHLFGDATSWRALRWESGRLQSAITTIEQRKWDSPPSTHTQQRLERARSFVQGLFADGMLSQPLSPTGVSNISHRQTGLDQALTANDVKQEPMPGIEVSMPHPYGNYPMTAIPASMAGVSGSEYGGKRPLSYDSSARVPHRNPPGPPSGPLHSYEQSSIPPAFHHQNTTTSSSAVYDLTATAPTTNSWHSSDQPPPYEGMTFPTASVPHTYSIHMPPNISTTATPMQDMHMFSSPMQGVLPTTQYPSNAAQTDAQILEMLSHHPTPSVPINAHAYHSAAPSQPTESTWLDFGSGIATSVAPSTTTAGLQTPSQTPAEHVHPGRQAPQPPFGFYGHGGDMHGMNGMG